MSCGVGRRCGLDPILLWLWFGPVSTAPIQPPAWEPQYAAGAVLKKQTGKKKKKIDDDIKRTEKPLPKALAGEIWHHLVVKISDNNMDYETE